MKKNCRVEQVKLAGLTVGREIDVIGRKKKQGSALENRAFLSLYLQVDHYGSKWWIKYHLNEDIGFSPKVREEIQKLEEGETTDVWEKRVKSLMRIKKGMIITVTMPDNWYGGPIKAVDTPSFLFYREKIDDLREEVGELPFFREPKKVEEQFVSTLKEVFPEAIKDE